MKKLFLILNSTLFILTSGVGQTTNNPGVPIFGAGGTSSGLQFVFVNGLGNVAYPPNFAAQNASSIVTSGGATNGVGTRVAFMSDSTNAERPIALVIDGDSESCFLYNGTWTNQTWPYWLLTNTMLSATATFTNSAVSGDYATNVANLFATRDEPQIQAALAANKTVYYMPYLGQNDLGNAQYPASVVQLAISNIWYMAHTNGPSVKVVAFQIPYNYGVSSTVLQQYTNFNTWVAGQTNNWDYLVNPLNVLSQSDTLDNLHYTVAGNQKLAKYVHQVVFGGGTSPSFTSSATFGSVTIQSNLTVATINGGTPVTGNTPSCWSYDVTSTLGRSAVTNYANTTPTVGSLGAVYFSTNILSYLILPVPYGHGFSNVVLTFDFESEVGATTTSISGGAFQTQSKRNNTSNSQVNDGTVNPSFILTAATQTRVVVTNSFANDSDPRQVIVLWNVLPASYGKNNLYLDHINAREQ